jgi:hypothetical protein
MSDDLFTYEPPTEPGWYWVRTSLWWGNERPQVVYYYADGTVKCGPVSYVYGRFKYGPRIPTPEQCAVLEKE